LGASGLVVELVPKRSLGSSRVVNQRISTIHIVDLSIHSAEHLFLEVLLGLPVVLLISEVIRLVLKDATIHVDMEHHMVNILLTLEGSLFV
jgi:hypothetical protein